MSYADFSCSLTLMLEGLVTVTFKMSDLLSIERILVRVNSAMKNSQLMPLLIKR